MKQIGVSDFNRIYTANQNLYDTVRNLVGPAQNQQLSCSVITLSACEDRETTPAGRVYSLFTYNVQNVWASGGFRGSYTQFNQSLMNANRADQVDAVPQINTYGTNMVNARLFDRPFVF